MLSAGRRRNTGYSYCKHCVQYEEPHWKQLYFIVKLVIKMPLKLNSPHRTISQDFLDLIWGIFVPFAPVEKYFASAE